MSSSNQIHDILFQHWKYDSFREKQAEIIQAVLDGKDTLALLPTGGGKSICFQVPAMAMEGICLVVSPLVALMEDQVSTLRKKGIKALAIHSGLSKKEIDIQLDNAAYGNFKFLYVSPERLSTELFIARLKKMKVNLIAIDEAHCISQWGYDFRPSYLEIVALRELLPEVPVLALTATATPKVVLDIQEKLKFRKSHLIQKSFERKNLAYVVQHEEDQFGKMMKILQGVKGSGIVYVNSRKKTKEIAQYLLRMGVSADYYHARLTYKERKTKQENWINNTIRIIVSTNAFGMGIDKPDVSLVIHLDLPESIEAYFQEAGRAGRDGKKAYAVLVLNPASTNELKERVEKAFPSMEQIKKVYLALCNFLQIPIGGGEEFSIRFNLKEFCDRFLLPMQETHYCLLFLEKTGYIRLNEGYGQSAKLHFLMNKEDLYRFQVSHKNLDGFIKIILRSYPGMFEDFVKIDEAKLAKNAHITTQKAVQFLDLLHQFEVLVYEKQSLLPKLFFTKARVSQSALKIPKEHYLDRKKTALDKLSAMLDYVNSQFICRSQLLLSYFGQKNSKKCGLCDCCLEAKKKSLSSEEFQIIEKQITAALGKEKLSIHALAKKVAYEDEEKFLACIDHLVDQGKLKSNGLLIEQKI